MATFSALLTCCLTFLLALSCGPGLTATGPTAPVDSTCRSLPLYFIANQGQHPEAVRYYALGGRLACFFARKGIYLAQPPSNLEEASTRIEPAQSARMVTIEPSGMNPNVTLLPLNPLEGRVNHLRGNAPGQWRRNLPTYQAVLYRQAYPGIDLKFYGNGSHLEYDIVIRPGGDPTRVKFRYQGVKGLRLTGSGDLAVDLPGGGELVHRLPTIYQEIGGARVAREGRFRVWREGSHWVSGFDLKPYDKRYALVIDPVLSFSTYLGGALYDEGLSIAVDASGYIYVTGRTFSLDFPTQDPYQLYWGIDAFVTKMKPDGSGLVYSTYFGGPDYDFGRAIAVDQAGCAHIAGVTKSTHSFPLKNPVQATYGGGSLDGFVTKFNDAGSDLVFSTYLGGSSEDQAYGIAVDQTGQVYVTGATYSTNFYTKAAMQSFNAGGYDVFITKFKADGAAVYSTYLGSNDYDLAQAIAADSEGNAYITGSTASAFFPLVNAYQSSMKGAGDAFVTKINATGSALAYSTFLGGDFVEAGYGIAVDKSGQAHVTGYTGSANFPTAKAWQPSLAGGTDAFVTKFNAAGTGLVYSTYLGGSKSDSAYGIAVTPEGQATITGNTWSTDFPRLYPVQPAFGGGESDAFVARFSPDGAALLYSTHLGGSGNDYGYAVAVDRQSNAYVTGKTDSGNFPTRRPFQASRAGDFDAFVVRLGQTGAAPLDLLLLD
jgi:hypothetical protein